ncbi:MAG: TRAP transporter substrate-binding protein DctP [Myxococcota bacterium]
MATLAPAGSAWMNLFDEASRNITQKTGGRVKFKYFPGGVQGDEKDSIRKVKAGQLAGTAITSVGLGQIYPDVRVLELPFMFDEDAEVDYVRDRLGPELQKRFEEKGWVLLAWGDVGWVHLFSTAPIKSKADLTKVKMWAWTDDPLVRRLFSAIGINGVALGVPEVLPALQTGMINAAYGSALSTLALQWYTRLKYMTEMRTSYSVGGAVVSKKAFDQLAPSDQKILREEAKRLELKLIAQIRKDNVAALTALKKQGLQVVPTPPELVKEFRAGAEKVWYELAGQLYSKELLEKVKALRAEYRSARK